MLIVHSHIIFIGLSWMLICTLIQFGIQSGFLWFHRLWVFESFDNHA